MRQFLFIRLVSASLVINVVAIPAAILQATETSGRPTVLRGVVSNEFGTYVTIEGVAAEGNKFETGTLLVDTVDGKELDKPIPLVVRAATIAEHNLRPGSLNLPAKRRCVLKGYETGEMIGLAPAIELAAKEKGLRDVPMSQVPWQWRTHFVALIIVSPAELEITGMEP